MDAQKIIEDVNNHFIDKLDQYYDHVAEAYVKVISEQYNLPIDELTSKCMDLKQEIMNSFKSKTKTNKSGAVKVINDNLVAKSRSQLQDLCTQNNLPFRRKNQDMIDQLSSLFDKQNITNDEELVKEV
jgi:hypothetical protein